MYEKLEEVLQKGCLTCGSKNLSKQDHPPFPIEHWPKRVRLAVQRLPWWVVCNCGWSRTNQPFGPGFGEIDETKVYQASPFKEMLGHDFGADRKIMLVGGDAVVLNKYANRLPWNTVIVEIGTYLGWSAVLLAAAASSRTHIWTIDNGTGRQIEHWLEPGQEYRSLVESTFMEMGYDDKITFLHGDSAEVDWPPDREIDLLFVDGDHSYEGALADLIRWAPKVKLNGYMLCHD